MQNSDKNLDRIKSLMHVIESGNKVLMNRMDKPDKNFQSPKERHLQSPDLLRNRSTNSHKQKSVSSTNFFPTFHRIRPETVKNQENKVLTTWFEAPKTTNTGAETTDRRISLENSKRQMMQTFVTPNKETNFFIKTENTGLKKKIEELLNENFILKKENERLLLQSKDFILKEKGLRDMYKALDDKHNERKKHMKQLIEIISEKEKQLEKAKSLHFEIINKKFHEKSPLLEKKESLEINHQKIIDYALFLENQLEAAEKRIETLMQENETIKDSLKEKLLVNKNLNIIEELKELLENVKTIEFQTKKHENQYNNQFQNLEESEKKVIKSSIDDLEDERQRLYRYIKGKIYLYFTLKEARYPRLYEEL